MESEKTVRKESIKDKVTRVGKKVLIGGAVLGLSIGVYVLNKKMDDPELMSNIDEQALTDAILTNSRQIMYRETKLKNMKRDSIDEESVQKYEKDLNELYDVQRSYISRRKQTL